MKPALFTAREAAARLGVSLATLYAYVSRGQIRSQAAPGDPRSRLYAGEDVEALARKKAHRQDPARAAAEALDWGAPVLDSALTRIGPEGPFYRGESALELAGKESFERVAALLWLDAPQAAESLFSPLDWPQPDARGCSIAALSRSLLDAAEDDLRAYDLSPESAAAAGARILLLLAATLGAEAPKPGRGKRPGALPGRIAAGLGAAWKAEPRLLEAALVLSADHELNASSFTARVVAGAGATPYSAVLAGLAALSGNRHGGLTPRAAALLREVGSPGRAAQVVADRLRSGEILPGFGHTLYTDGDPRARALLERLAEKGHAGAADSEALETVREVARVVASSTGRRPNIDLALAALEVACNLPHGAGLALFALGRSVGLVAHAVEQYQSGRLIRPRARYVGR